MISLTTFFVGVPFHYYPVTKMIIFIGSPLYFLYRFLFCFSKETVIEKSTPLVQNRIAIDRFTGGTLHGALFDEQPIYGGDETVVTLDLFLRQVNDPNQNNAEIGLLLLLIKDLWTSDLAIGGESSIGRGRLQGIKAEITRFIPEKSNEYWEIIQEQEQLKISEANVLENFVSEFNKLFNGVLV